MSKKGQGFTLVELAIVLVVIGIILGAVIKGQELVFNAKVKRLQSQIKEVIAAIYTYYDKYGYFPGDDPLAGTRFNETGINGNGNGVIDGETCNAQNEESCWLWRHLRYANIISGDANQTSPTAITPKHAWGGAIDVFHNTSSVGGTSRTGLWIALSNLPGEAAEALDRLMDDGKCSTGSMGALGGTCGTNGIYQRNATYTVLLSF